MDVPSAPHRLRGWHELIGFVLQSLFAVAKAGVFDELIFLKKLRVKIRSFLKLRSGIFQRSIYRPRIRQKIVGENYIPIHRAGGLGDVLMCTPAIRLLKQKNPTLKVDFYTDFPEIVRGLSYIDNVYRANETSSGEAIDLRYEFGGPPKTHIAKLFGDQLGLYLKDTRPDCIVPRDKETYFREVLSQHSKPWIVILRKASSWTPNKNWPNESWENLLHSLSDFGTIIEIGQSDQAIPGNQYSNHLDLRGQTDIGELAALIKLADCYLGPVSGPMHIAAAVGTRAIVIYGGYEPPEVAGYPGQINLVNKPSCSPCWLREPCPYDLTCLRAIEPTLVERQIRALELN